MANLSERLKSQESCSGPLDCAQLVGTRLADRALAGLNRVMEQGVEPIARMIWTPKPSTRDSTTESADSPEVRDRSPLPEPPITADPLVLLEQPPGDGLTTPLDPALPPFETNLPPDLPPPEVIEPNIQVNPAGSDLENDGVTVDSFDSAQSEESESAEESERPLIGAPPPPLLPPSLP